MSKSDLIDMIITERSKEVTHTPEDTELTKEEARELLKNIIPEIKAKPKLLNN